MTMIVFDLDGTLVDSRPEITAAIVHAWTSVLGEAVPFPHDRFRVGPPLVETVTMLGPTLAPAERDAIVAAFRARYDASDFSATLPYAGVVDAITELAARSVPLAVATNKRLPPTLAILARWFGGRFARVACIDGVFPDDGARPKTKAEMIHWCMADTAEAMRTTMVGDTKADVAAAHEVGIRAIGVTWGYEDGASLEAAGADVLVADAKGLLQALNVLGLA